MIRFFVNQNPQSHEYGWHYVAEWKTFETETHIQVEEEFQYRGRRILPKKELREISREQYETCLFFLSF